jgi:hypothetical protein
MQKEASARHIEGEPCRHVVVVDGGKGLIVGGGISDL